MKFVLMVPLRRCGSNALRLRLNLHPDFYSPYPLHVGDLPDCQYSNDDVGYFQQIVDLVGLQRHSLVPWDDIVFDPIEIFKNIRNKPRNLYQIYWEMLSQIGRKHNAKVVMDKCQDTVCDYEKILSLFPNMLFLDVVRDPRAQISSMNDAIIYDFDTQLNTLRWVEARQWVDKIRKTHPDQIMTIRYEDFIMKQEDTMRSICSFLGMPFDPIVLDVGLSLEAYHMSHVSPLWETNYSQPIVQYIDKFVNHLTMTEIAQIEHLTLPWMKEFHYQRMTHHDIPFFDHVSISHEKSEEKKKSVWKALKQKYPYDYVLRKTRTRYLNSLMEKT